MQLTSTAFKNEGDIPKRFSGEGEDISPELRWSEVPKETKSFALVCNDPDAPKSPGKDHPFVHWVIYNLSPNTSFLPGGLAKQEVVSGAPIEATQGHNSFGKVGYGGPMPPQGHGLHHYHFTLYALNTELGLKPGATCGELLKAIEPHVIDQAELIGHYERLEMQGTK